MWVSIFRGAALAAVEAEDSTVSGIGSVMPDAVPSGDGAVATDAIFRNDP
jgi:hypothetical protein